MSPSPSFKSLSSTPKKSPQLPVTDRNRFTKFMHLLLKYPHNIELVLLLLKLDTLRFFEIAEWTKLCLNMSKATTYRRLQELVHAKLLQKTIMSHKEVYYTIARPARKTFLRLLRALNLVQTRNQAGTLITQITTPHITHQLNP